VEESVEIVVTVILCLAAFGLVCLVVGVWAVGKMWRAAWSLGLAALRNSMRMR
jgi:hypothetical protein